jgi:hypothetical protein
MNCGRIYSSFCNFLSSSGHFFFRETDRVNVTYTNNVVRCKRFVTKTHLRRCFMNKLKKSERRDYFLLDTFTSLGSQSIVHIGRPAAVRIIGVQLVTCSTRRKYEQMCRSRRTSVAASFEPGVGDDRCYRDPHSRPFAVRSRSLLKLAYNYHISFPDCIVM